MRTLRLLLTWMLVLSAQAALSADKPDCSRSLSLALHDHGLLYSAQANEGIDKDIADELARRSGCKLSISVMPRARIWQLIESGGLDFSLSGITNESRDKFAAFAWYFSNKYYLLVRQDAGVKTLADFERNSSLRLGAIRSFRYNPSANQLVDKLDADQRVSFANHLDPLYEILLDKRIQAMVIEPFDYPTVQRAVIRAQTSILEFDDPPVPHGLIMSKKSLPLAQQEAWRAIVMEMRADGTVQRIFQRYFPADLARTLTPY